jgi:large subunit ribosomal protein L18
MAQKFTMQYRRKREGRTDYKKRLVLLKSGLPRLVIRLSNKGAQAQIVAYEPDGDKVLATATTKSLAKFGWTRATGNIPAAYLAGLLLAKRVKGKISSDVILDIGLQKHHKGGRIYAVAKGAIDGGIQVRIGEETLPSDERAAGSHLEGAADAFNKAKAAIMK